MNGGYQPVSVCMEFFEAVLHILMSNFKAFLVHLDLPTLTVAQQFTTLESQLHLEFCSN